MNLKKPNLAQIKDPSDLLSLLVDYYSALVELDGKRSPEKLPGLKSITAPNFPALRMTPGDDSGQDGPRVSLLAGGATVLDGLQGAFAWDSTSTARDDNSTIINPNGAKPGRWRRIAWSGVNLALSLFTSTASGIVPASGGGTSNFLRADGAWAAPAAAGRLLAVRVLSGASTAKTPGTTLAWARIWAGGGGGGGAAASFGCYGAGGAQGGYAEYITTTIPANWTHSIGAGGAGGNSSGSDGSVGGSTTFSDGSVTVTANGGPGGSGDSTGSTSVLGGSPPAISTNGTLNASGAPGGNAFLGGWTGQGGGIGGGKSLASAIGAVTGNAGRGFSGGGGGGEGSAGSGAGGGAGAPGQIILAEFS